MSALRQFSLAAERLAFQRMKRARAERGGAMADQIPIDKGVPIPPACDRGGWPIKGYAAVLRRLEPTDSVRLPLSQAAAGAMANRVLGSGCYVTRAEGSHTRIWRTK